MEITKELLLKYEKFQKHLNSLENKDSFIDRLDSFLQSYKLENFKTNIPKDFTFVNFADSLLLNLQQDYNSIISNLPSDFIARESKERIHIGNVNQIGIYYQGKKRVACLNVYFQDKSGSKFMYIDNIQGDIKSSTINSSLKEIHKTFGKLNNYFGEDWRAGLSKQLVDYAKTRDIKVKGKVPGLFFLFESSITDYPIYSLNYVQTFLRSGIPFEDIEISPLQNGFEWADSLWSEAISSLKLKDLEDRLTALNSASKEYTKFYNDSWEEIYKDCSKFEDFKLNCKKESIKVFEKYLF